MKVETGLGGGEGKWWCGCVLDGGGHLVGFLVLGLSDHVCRAPPLLGQVRVSVFSLQASPAAATHGTW
jgi:hypothetical protein